MELGLAAIRRALDLIQPRVITDPLLAGAAVLIPIIESDNGPLLLFTRRTETVRYHKGQISFPGGAQDGTEPLESTALRETEEEIGVTPEKVEIIGRFHDYLSSSNYRVTPFVALVSPDAQFVLNSGEVAYLITVPLRFFAENQPECRMMERRGQETAVYFYRKEDQVIWGLTARIVKEFVETVVQSMQQKTPRRR